MGAGRLIRETARQLAADLQTAGRGFTIEVVPPEPIPRPVQELAAALGHRIPEPLPESISIRHDGEEHIGLVFDDERDFSRQLAEALDQVQDVVAEITTELWPPCPGHRHPMTPIADQNLVRWSCPLSEEVLVPLGQLSARRVAD
jgi:hypothetical protein